MGFREEYTTTSRKQKVLSDQDSSEGDKERMNNKTVISEEAYAICTAILNLGEIIK